MNCHLSYSLSLTLFQVAIIIQEILIGREVQMQWHLLKMKLEMFWAGLIQFKTQTANPLQSLLICQNFIEI